MRKFIMAATAVAALAIPAIIPSVSSAAAGGTTTCTAGTGEANALRGLIKTNLDVPAGASCQLDGAEVQGNITVEGSLSTFSATADKNVIVNGGHFYSGNYGGEIKGNLSISNSQNDGWIANGFWNEYGSEVVDGNVNYTDSGPLYVQGPFPAIVKGNFNSDRPAPAGVTVCGHTNLVS